MAEGKSGHSKPLLIPMFLLTGFIYTFTAKLQTAQAVTEAGIFKHFFHPCIQCLIFSASEACCLALYYLHFHEEYNKIPPPPASGISERLLKPSHVEMEKVEKYNVSRLDIIEEGDENSRHSDAATPKEENRHFSELSYGRVSSNAHKSTIFFLPGTLDCCSNLLQMAALAFISSSTFMMLKGASIITTLIFSRSLVKMTIQSRHLVGCGLSLLGLILMGLAEICIPDQHAAVSNSQNDTNNALIGYTLMISSLIFNGYYYAYEEKLLREHSTIKPIEMVGFEGLYALPVCFLAIFISSFIPCGDDRFCVYSNSDDFSIGKIDKMGSIENLPVYLYEVFTSPFLFLLVISAFVCIPLYSYYGVTVTKVHGSFARSLINVLRTVLLWVFGVVVSLCVSEDSFYRIERLDLSVNFIKFLGFISIILGTMVYNQVILQEQLPDKHDKSEPEPEEPVPRGSRISKRYSQRLSSFHGEMGHGSFVERAR